MKFAQYLEDTQIPEWKKAYIDYRGLKKRITAIRRAQAAAQPRRASTSTVRPSPLIDPTWSHAPEETSDSTILPPPALPPHTQSLRSADHVTPAHGSDTEFEIVEDAEHHVVLAEDAARPSIESSSSISRTGMHSAGNLRRRNTTLSIFSRGASQTKNHEQNLPDIPTSPKWDLAAPPPLMDLLPQLAPVERTFFDALDAELDKVESFYCEREKELKDRTAALKKQLQELKDHRRVFHEAHPLTSSQPAWITVPLTRLRRRMPNFLSHEEPHQDLHLVPTHSRILRSALSTAKGKALDAQKDGAPSEPLDALHLAEPAVNLNDTLMEKIEDMEIETANRSLEMSPPHTHVEEEHQKAHPHHDGHLHVHKRRNGPHHKHSGNGAGPKLDPEEYQNAKRKLKRAVLECYRGLEILNNYRTLNLIGFRKALKKFEKVTKVPVQHAYTTEKIDPSAFASGANVEDMIREMEDLFAARFARGDRKKAMTRLRGWQHQSHHSSSFTTGLLLGLAVPAFVDGVYQSFQTETRAALPAWDGLLFVYAIFFIPILLSILVGVNTLVWASARINYVFIFELDVRARLDRHAYFEIPSILLAMLCYAFWLSFNRIGSHTVAPTTWPLIWLLITVGIMLNPLPLLNESSRWWFIRIMARLATPGLRRVEFTDFWMGDQFCSLVFTLSNIFFIGCAYSRGLDNWQQCTAGRYWGPEFALACIPFLIRVIQSIKRWVDSRLITHLINAGKYASGVLMYLFYYLWRNNGGGRGAHFVVWCIFATNYSIYASSWDLLMDWSLLRPHAKYPLLRSELLYPTYAPLYYMAIVSNVLIRFIWVFYIPEHGPNYVLRTFIAGMLESLRRWQWNFIRLENEHLGNVDQYRVTREVPLPYTFEEMSRESDGEDEDDMDRHSTSSMSWRRWKPRSSPTEHADAGNES